ncbi:MAG: flagellar brake protein [Treponema sp.]|nr:flagellar brake protein [Treponema sp.]
MTNIDVFTFEDPTFSPGVMIFFLVIAIIIITLVVINNASKNMSTVKSKSSGGGGGLGASGLFSFFKLRKIAKNIGLDNAQTKMLDFVFKSDNVTEPERSLANSTLLDRHFRRAFRILEHSYGSGADIQKKLAVLFSTRNILENSPMGTVSSTRQLREDAVLTMNYGREKYDVTVHTAKTEHLIVDAPKNVLGSQIKIPHGTRITVVFFTKGNKGFSFETRVVGHSNMHGRSVLQLAHSNNIRFLALRRFRRKSAAIDCSLNLVYIDTSEKKQRFVIDKRKLNGTIADISVGGCSIKANAPVQVGAKFKIEFIQRNVNVTALGQVLRTNRAGMNTTIHVKFLRISQKSMNLINAFVYEYTNS